MTDQCTVQYVTLVLMYNIDVQYIRISLAKPKNDIVPCHITTYYKYDTNPTEGSLQ